MAKTQNKEPQVEQQEMVQQVRSQGLLKRNNNKVRIYNLTNHVWSEDKLSFLLLGPKFVPLTEGDMTQLKIDVLNFSRKILLKAHFHNVEYSDKSLIKPASNFIPTSTKYPVLKSVIRDLEMFANELEDLERTEVTDNTGGQKK